jgi:hypothetical protein
MSEDDRKDKRLPITAEVGGEGGSYAEASQQAETFTGATGDPRVDPKAVTSADGDVTNAAAEGEPVLESPQMVKHATEPPEQR